jgi:hypothetical protein
MQVPNPMLNIQGHQPPATTAHRPRPACAHAAELPGPHVMPPAPACSAQALPAPFPAGSTHALRRDPHSAFAPPPHAAARSTHPHRQELVARLAAKPASRRRQSSSLCTCIPLARQPSAPSGISASLRPVLPTQAHRYYRKWYRRCDR